MDNAEADKLQKEFEEHNRKLRFKLDKKIFNTTIIDQESWQAFIESKQKSICSY